MLNKLEGVMAKFKYESKLQTKFEISCAKVGAKGLYDLQNQQ